MVADLDECAFLDADVEQIQQLINVDVEDMAAQLIPLQSVSQTAEEEKEESLQIGRKTDDLQELQVVPPPLDALYRPLNPRLQWFSQSYYIDVDGHRTEEVYGVFGPSRAQVLNENEVCNDGNDLYDQWCEDVPLGEEEGLRGIIKSECVDRGHQLIQVLTHSVSNLLIGVIGADIVETAKHLHHVFGEVEDGCDDNDAEYKIDQQGTLVEDTNEILAFSFETDLIGESDVETADEEVSEDEGEDGGHAHTNSDESTITATPPEVDDDDCAAEYLADGSGQDGAEEVLLILLLHL